MLKEILTKAVVSKGKILDTQDIYLDVKDNANKAIGCWVINHNYLSVVENNVLYASGFYDIHIWYAINDSTDTQIYKTTIDYKHEFEMDNKVNDLEKSEFKLYCIEYPTCSNLKLVNNQFVVTIKKGLAVDVIGESKLLVQVSDTFANKEDNMGINTNYLNK